VQYAVVVTPILLVHHRCFLLEFIMRRHMTGTVIGQRSASLEK